MGTAVCCFSIACSAQDEFSRADTLRGSLRPTRTCYDVVHYGLDLELHPSDSTVSGTIDIAYLGVRESDSIQLDLSRLLDIEHVQQGGMPLGYERIDNAVFVALARPTRTGELDTLSVRYAGKPKIAVQPPWDGGLIWARDSLDRPWISVSCEGAGASTWWPNKDYLGDEPDSVSFSLTVPDELTVVSNGRFVDEQDALGGKTKFSYATSYPINNYNVTFYAGHYLSFGDTLNSPDVATPLQLNYSVLDYNLERAEAHFAEEVKPMLRCYEGYFGPYPFWRDGYRLIEAPFLGMEHQSAIAYGNNYQRGYLGGMIPDDMGWDYLIVHESGHEYFGNAVSVADHAEMWLHESFTTYLEALYVECRFGHDAYDRYLAGQFPLIENADPMVGPLGVNFLDFRSSDQYFKGSWMLHTFRSAVRDDSVFFDLLRGFYDANFLREGGTTTQHWLDYVSSTLPESNWEPFFEHYLTEPNLPVLRVRLRSNKDVTAHFTGVDGQFHTPIWVGDARFDIGTQPTTLSGVSASDWELFRPQDYLFEYDSK